MAMTARIAAKFNAYYAEKPLPTTMFTNAVLGGIADTVAQLLTAVKTHSKWKVPIVADQLTSTKVLDQDEGRFPSVEELAHDLACLL
ncbi:hypothetical protein VN97_g12055 [Penicillium thymicola]|uniref:Uncharacterized protein n=1 Tax=Penicillium thymicola TaxID=293382 RepID=A0AAI9X2X2_PENTH|nr:hypothetical protein VN97_g12055 [Penicillium thymicola]